MKTGISVVNHPSESLPPTSTSPNGNHEHREAPSQSGAAEGAHRAASSPADIAVERFRRRVAAKQSGLGDPEPEQSLWEGRYSGKAMGGLWLSALVATIAVAVVAAIYAVPAPIFAAAIVAVIWLVAGAVYAARRLGIHYELTTQRFIHQHGVLSRRTDRIEVIDIDDVSFHQGPIQRMLGIGTIEITSADRSHPHLVMPGIAEVKTVAGLIDDVRRRERQRRSLHIRSM